MTKRGMTVVQPDNESVRGMIFKIKHMLAVEAVAPGTDGVEMK